MTLQRLFILSLLGAFIVSCQSSTNLTSNSLIQKRRYTKGFHVNVKNNKTPKAEERAEATLQPINHNLEASVNTANPIENPGLKDEHAIVFAPARDQSPKDVSKESTMTEQAAPPSSSQLTMTYPLKKSQVNHHTNGSDLPPVAPAAPASKLLIIILTILLPPLGAALVFGLAAEFWISLLLTLLFYVPGLIYTLIVVLREY